MKIGILGTGTVSQTLAGALLEAGHQVIIGTRDPKATRTRTEPDSWGNPGPGTWIAEHPGAKLVTMAEAAQAGELLINATAGMVSLAALELAGAANLGNKILIDVANPLDFSAGFPPSLSVSNTDSLGEQIQRAYPDLRVVKALNTMSAVVMVNPASVPGEHNLFLAGNDEAAKKEVSALLVESFGWPATSLLDLGDITMARGTEMLLPLWVRLFAKLGTPVINFHIAGRPQ